MSFEHDKRVIIYPNYLDSRKTVAMGRRVPKELACEAPNAIEIAECIINGLKLEAQAEMKRYPRDWMVPGRVRVKLLNEDGTPVNPEVPTRRALLLKVAELVPRHPGRVNRKPAPAVPAVAAGPSSSGAGGSAKQQQQQQGGKKKSSKKK